MSEGGGEWNNGTVWEVWRQSALIHVSYSRKTGWGCIPHTLVLWRVKAYTNYQYLLKRISLKEYHI